MQKTEIPMLRRAIIKFKIEAIRYPGSNWQRMQLGYIEDGLWPFV